MNRSRVKHIERTLTDLQKQAEVNRRLRSCPITLRGGWPEVVEVRHGDPYPEPMDCTCGGHHITQIIVQRPASEEEFDAFRKDDSAEWEGIEI